MSESDYGQGRMNLPKDFDKHASVFYSDPSSFCWEKGEQTPSVLRNRVLAARELTDMILIEWPRAMSHERDAVFSLGRALVLGGTRLLELDERELGMELVPLRDKKLGIAVYDTAPGGAGHCRELVDDGEKWIEATRGVLYVNHRHHLRCRKACLECILDFSGQYFASRLNRPAALDLLDAAML